MSQILKESKYLERVNRLKKRVLNTLPEMDLENARILTEGLKRRKESPW